MQKNNSFKNQYIIPIVLAVVGVYLIYKNFVGKKTDELPTGGETPPPPPPPVKVDPNVGSTTPQTSLGSIKSYIVTTTSGNLNMRSLPSATATIVGSLVRNSEIKARPSTISGWYEVVEVSAFGNPYQVTTKGYVSSAFLVPKG